MSQTLIPFYPCAGRLRPNSILCNGAGIEFIEASAVRMSNTSFTDLEADAFRPCPLFRSLAPHDGIQPTEDPDEPLLSIQVTQLRGGGVAVGITINHVLADGFSLWHFMNSWAECARGLPISKIPFHDRQLISFIDLNSKRADETNPELSFDSNKPKDRVQVSDARIEKKAEKEKHDSDEDIGNARDDGVVSKKKVDQEKHDGKGEGNATAPEDGLVIGSDARIEKEVEQEKHDNNDEDNGNGNARNELCEQLFRVSKEKLAKLKAMASEGEGGVIPSSYEALCAHFWRHVTKARGLSGEKKNLLILPVNIRSHVEPPLPPYYFGNAVLGAFASATAA